jgi:hypothetical protein
MKDLTVIYYTANTMESRLFKTAQEQLLKAIGDLPLISVSQKPMDFGENICVGEIGVSTYNLYKQALEGAKAAKTKYVAMAEDDTLYSPEHFHKYKPSNRFMYDLSRWSVFTWTKPPIYSWKDRETNNMLTAPRDLLIETLEERYAKYTDPNNYPLHFWAEPGRFEKQLGLTKRPMDIWMSYVPSIMFTHPEAMGYGYQGERKRHGLLRAFDIPYWGTAQKVMEDFYNED